MLPNGSDALLESISKTASAAADGIIDESRAVAEERKRAAADYAERIKADAERKAEESAALTYERLMGLYDLECSKIALSAKQRVLSAVYDKVEQGLISLDDKAYADFYLRAVCADCRDGDKVEVGDADKSRLNAEWLKKTAASCKKKLTLSGTFPGRGVILKNSDYDKDLTVRAVIEELRSKSESETAKEIFG